MKRKGFTLIELLAVIVILAIILAIAVPTISNMISASTKSAFESNAKLVLKSVNYKKLENESFDETELTKDNITSLLGLSSDNYESVNIIREDGNAIISIVGKNKWNGLVACGTSQNMKVVTSLTDCSSDLISPVITINGNLTVSINQGDVYVDLGATALDNRDGDITSKITVTSNVNPNVPGTYTVTYSVTDIAGNKGTATRTVTVIDTVSPVITFGTNGNTTYAKSRSTTVSVTDAGGIDVLKYLWNTSTTTLTESSFVSSLSFTSGDEISTPTGVNGSYYLWVLSKDRSGNVTISRSNSFNLDSEAPVITINGSNPVTVNKGSSYTDAGATATDNIDSTVTVTSTGTVNPNIVGTYTITYSAKDTSGNVSIPVTRTINVVDVNAPVITINGSNPVTTELGYYYSDAGATAVDDVDGNVTSKIIITSNVSTGIAGSYTVTYTVTDKAGNETIATRTVNVVDTVAPTAPTFFGMTYSDITLNYTNDTWANRAVYMYGGINGSTDAGGILKYQISADNINWVDYVYDYTNPMYGITTEGISYRYARAVDKSGNVSPSISRIIKIDVTAPTVPTFFGMTYADGTTSYTNDTWATQAVYMYGGISGSTDANGILKYQISADNTNWVDYVYNGSQAMYGITTEGITYRYARAVDYAGNVSNSLGRTIRIDYNIPVHTNWWWGPATSSGASLYIQATDAISGINRVQCPTSTESGGYANWYWFNSVWDASANAYRCDITSSTFNHYGQQYVTHLYIWDNAGLGGYYNATSFVVPNLQVTLNFDSDAEITNNFNFVVSTANTPNYASVVSDAGTAKFSTTGLDARYILHLKPVTNGINDIEFSMGIWPSTYTFLTNMFGLTFNDNSTIYFFVKHASTYSGYNQYLPVSAGYTNNFAIKNNIDGSTANLGAAVPDGYVTYKVSVNASNVLTMTASTGQTYSYNIGSRKIISIILDPMYQWYNTATIGRIDYLKYMAY